MLVSYNTEQKKHNFHVPLSNYSRKTRLSQSRKIDIYSFKTFVYISHVTTRQQLQVSLCGRPPSPSHVTVPPFLSQRSYLINDHNVHDNNLIKK